MSMQLAHPIYSTTRAARKVLTGKPKTSAQKKHEAFIASVTKGCKSSKEEKNKAFRKDYRENMVVDRTRFQSEGAFGTATSCVKKGVLTNLHKESPEIQKEILAKASRIAPAYNKSGLIYITDGMDLKTLGNKV